MKCGKLVTADISTVVGVGARLGGVSISCSVAERGWDNWRRLLSVRGGEAPFRSREAVGKEGCRETDVSVERSHPSKGLLDGDERAERCGLVDLWRSATLGRAVIICRILPAICVSLFILPRGTYGLVVEFHRMSVFEREHQRRTV
jgi:hypothetical protein